MLVEGVADRAEGVAEAKGRRAEAPGRGLWGALVDVVVGPSCAGRAWWTTLLSPAGVQAQSILNNRIGIQCGYSDPYKMACSPQ